MTVKATQSLLLAVGLVAFSGAFATGQGGIAETNTAYLDSKRSYSLTGLGVGLDLAVSSGGIVYLASETRLRLWRLDASRRMFKPFGEGHHCSQGGKVFGISPTAIYADSRGELWALDRDAGAVQRISADGSSNECYSTVPANGAPDRPQSSQLRKITRFMMLTPSSGGQPDLQPLPEGMRDCVKAPDQDLFCIMEASRDLVRTRNGRVVARFQTPEKYGRLGGVATGPDGDLYVSDSSGRQLLRLSPGLILKQYLPLYQSLFRTPGRLRIVAGELWLIDEGRQELLRFRLRFALTGMEHKLLGEEYLALGLYQNAQREFDFAEASGEAVDRIDKGRALYGLGRFQEALTAFSALKRAKDADLWLANSLFRLGRFEPALDAYKRAAKQQQTSWPATFNQAQTLLALGRFAQAESLFAVLEGMSPGNPQIGLGLGRAALANGEFSKAIEVLKPLRDDSRVGREARHYLGSAYLLAGAHETALPLLEQAAREGPHFRQALDALAATYQALGRHADARRAERWHDSLGRRTPGFDTFLLEETSR